MAFFATGSRYNSTMYRHENRLRLIKEARGVDGEIIAEFDKNTEERILEILEKLKIPISFIRIRAKLRENEHSVL